MKIEFDLTYREFSFLREALLEKREKIWKDTIEPFIPKKATLTEIRAIRVRFNGDLNSFGGEGVCNSLLNTIDQIEVDLWQDLKRGLANKKAKVKK